MPRLNTLPEEMLSMICGLVNDDDLPRLRFVCECVGAAATRQFAITFFTQPNHVPSLDSITKLVEMTGHPYFGQFVQKVNISFARPTGTNKKAPEIPRYLTAYLFDTLMEQVFKNIKRHRSTIEIGVFDYTFKPDRWGNSIRLTHLPLGYYSILAMSPAETSNRTLRAAHRAGCAVEDLEAVARYPRFIGRSGRNEPLSSTITARFRQNPFSFHIHLRKGGARYNHKTGALDVFRLENEEDTYFGLFSAIPVYRLCLDEPLVERRCDFRSFHEALIKPHLETLTDFEMKNSTTWRSDRWDRTFKLLATSKSLKSFFVHDCGVYKDDSYRWVFLVEDEVLPMATIRIEGDNVVEKLANLRILDLVEDNNLELE